MGCRLTIVLALCMLGTPRWARGVELYWNDELGIERLEPPAGAGHLLYDTFAAHGLAIDAASQRIIWTDILPIVGPIPPGVVRAGSLDGSHFDDVVTRLDEPWGVAFDRQHGKLYWTDFGSATRPSAIYMANLDGSDARPIISGPSLSAIAGLAIDTLHEQLYFTYINPLIDGLFPGAIGRAQLDGAGVETIVRGLGQPLGIAVDAVGDGVYWADAMAPLSAGGGGAILAALLDGSHQRTILAGLDTPFGVALDLEHRDVYWTLTKPGLIQRTSMSGILPFFQTVVSGLDRPTAIAIVPEPHSLMLALVGVASLWGFARRRSRPATASLPG